MCTQITPEGGSHVRRATEGFRVQGSGTFKRRLGFRDEFLSTENYTQRTKSL